MDRTVYFVSGHINLTPQEFKQHYVPRLDNALKTQGCSFVVGDAHGTDLMTQEFLNSTPLDTKVTVYHMFQKPRCHVGDFKTQGGFSTDENRDEAMTMASDVDIAWVRPVYQQRALYGTRYKKRKSGTQKNIERRTRFPSKK